MAGTNRWFACALMLVLGGLSACASSSKATRGHDAREDLSTEVKRLSQGVEMARLHLERAVDAYQVLVEREANDPVEAYADLAKALEHGRERQKALDMALADVEETARLYFERWQKEVGGFLDETMQARAEKRLDTVRKRYDNMRESLEPALVGTAMVLDRLQDQVLFLKYDLSPQAVSLLSRDLNVMSRDRKRLSTRTVAIQDRADRFAESLRTDGQVQFDRDDTGDLPTSNPVEDGD